MILAAKLHLAGRTAEAVAFLQETLLTLLPQERASADEFRLLIGLIADVAPGGAGRVALNQLLESGSNPERQRVALQCPQQRAFAEWPVGQHGNAALLRQRQQALQLVVRVTGHARVESIDRSLRPITSAPRRLRGVAWGVVVDHA